MCGKAMAQHRFAPDWNSLSFSLNLGNFAVFVFVSGSTDAVPTGETIVMPKAIKEI